MSPNAAEFTAVATEHTLQDVEDKLGEISTAVGGAIVARTAHLPSAALPGAGAFTAQTAYTIPEGIKRIAYLVSYTRGAAGGFVRLRLVWSDGTDEAREAVIDAAVTVAAPNGRQPVYLSELDGPVPADGTVIRFVVEATVPAGMLTGRLLAAEAGVVGTPGTASITLTAGS
jgi:hypothetical protein